MLPTRRNERKSVKTLSAVKAPKQIDVNQEHVTPQQADTLREWTFATSRKIGVALVDLEDQIRVCKLAREQSGSDPELAEHEAGLVRQWAILEDMDGDLNNPQLVLEMWQQREAID